MSELRYSRRRHHRSGGRVSGDAAVTLVAPHRAGAVPACHTQLRGNRNAATGGIPAQRDVHIRTAGVAPQVPVFAATHTVQRRFQSRDITETRRINLEILGDELIRCHRWRRDRYRTVVAILTHREGERLIAGLPYRAVHVTGIGRIAHAAEAVGDGQQVVVGRGDDPARQVHRCRYGERPVEHQTAAGAGHRQTTYVGRFAGFVAEGLRGSAVDPHRAAACSERNRRGGAEGGDITREGVAVVVGGIHRAAAVLLESGRGVVIVGIRNRQVERAGTAVGQQDRTIISIVTAAVVVGRAGLLDARTAVEGTPVQVHLRKREGERAVEYGAALEVDRAGAATYIDVDGGAAQLCEASQIQVAGCEDRIADDQLLACCEDGRSA